MKNYLLQCDVTARHYNVLNTTYSNKRYLLFKPYIVGTETIVY